MTARWTAAVVVLALLAGASSAPAQDAAPVPLPRLFGGPFSLVDQDGMRRTNRDFHGQFALVYFGYTYCPDICPTGLATIAAALDMLGSAASRVQPVFITVDPGRDSPDALKDYVAQFHPRLIGLSGSEAEVRAAARAYRVHRAKVLGDGGADGDDYLVTHSSITYLMDGNGAFVTMFPHGTDAERMATVLETYLD